MTTETLNMTTQSGFITAYMINLKIANDQRLAYEMTEVQYMELHNVDSPKYKCWDVFRRVKNRALKNNY